jgi:hypothetical protein
LRVVGEARQPSEFSTFRSVFVIPTGAAFFAAEREMKNYSLYLISKTGRNLSGLHFLTVGQASLPVDDARALWLALPLNFCSLASCKLFAAWTVVAEV